MPSKKAKATPLDQMMVNLGLSDDITHSRALIMQAKVLVGGTIATNPSQLVVHTTHIDLRRLPTYYGRGGIKLAHALNRFNLDVANSSVLDIGASTGGFTHCLLEHGAAHVFSLDVGYGQLDYRLRKDHRVTTMERVNARRSFNLEQKVSLITIDVSFISLSKILHSVVQHLDTGGHIVALVKPQFEAKKHEVGRGGIILNPAIHSLVLARIIAWAIRKRFRIRDLTPSPINGDKGNREFFLLLSPGLSVLNNPVQHTRQL